jgi:hypothetical protein
MSRAVGERDLEKETRLILRASDHEKGVSVTGGKARERE